MHPILTVPNPILRTKSKPIRKFDAKVGKLIQQLEETLVKKKNPQGVGLSAVQIGTPLRVFATYLPRQSFSDGGSLEADLSDRDDLAGKPQVVRLYINPQIIRASKTLTLGPNPKKPILEGCLSIPGIYGPVKRHEWVKLKYYAPRVYPVSRRQVGIYGATSHKLREQRERFSGFTARVIQHELDHLDGVLFTDRALEQKQPIYEERNGKLELIELT